MYKTWLAEMFLLSLAPDQHDKEVIIIGSGEKNSVSCIHVNTHNLNKPQAGNAVTGLLGEGSQWVCSHK